MKVDFPGLLCEKTASGTLRYRVRLPGRKTKRIALHVTPDHPNFREHYLAARAGVQLNPEPDKPGSDAITGSVGWLIEQYQAAMAAMLENRQIDASTVKQRSTFLAAMRADVGEYSMKMPQAELIKLRDKRAATPGSADNFVKSVRAMYAWALARDIVTANPAAGISKINRDGTGAKPWTLDDLTAYRERHSFGTMAHLALTLFMFTACRIGDAVLLGRGHEQLRGNTLWLDMQPSKRGSSRVRIPMLPPLYKATRAVTVVGPTYLLNEHGKPFASKNALGNKFRQWCDEAGLKGLSSHGIRKAAGELLALQGASQYHIMAVHGHSSAKTSEVYTKGVERDRLAEQAMHMLEGMEW